MTATSGSNRGSIDIPDVGEGGDTLHRTPPPVQAGCFDDRRLAAPSGAHGSASVKSGRQIGDEVVGRFNAAANASSSTVVAGSSPRYTRTSATVAAIRGSWSLPPAPPSRDTATVARISARISTMLEMKNSPWLSVRKIEAFARRNSCTAEPKSPT